MRPSKKQNRFFSFTVKRLPSTKHSIFVRFSTFTKYSHLFQPIFMASFLLKIYGHWSLKYSLLKNAENAYIVKVTKMLRTNIIERPLYSKLHTFLIEKFWMKIWNQCFDKKWIRRSFNFRLKSVSLAWLGIWQNTKINIW